MKKVAIIICLFFVGFAASAKPYVILISIDGFRHDLDEKYELENFEKIKNGGVCAYSLKPVFPSTSFPNSYTIVTGMYPENHGIISNYFKNPYTGEIFDIADETSENPKWYQGEPFWELAKRYGIKTASYHWFATNLDAEYKNPDYVVNFANDIDFEDRLDKILEWLNLPIEERPRFICQYLFELDEAAHKHGTGSSRLIERALKIDKYIGDLIDTVKTLRLGDSVNFIIAANQGIMDIADTNRIDLDSIIANDKCEVINYGAYAMVYSGESDSVYANLEAKSVNYRVYKKSETPNSLRFSRHPFIGDLLILAKPGWLLTDKSTAKDIDKLKAAQGYNNNILDMRGVFYATGPAFKKKCLVGNVRNVDIYPLLCRIFGLEPKSNIDGDLERIELILKE